MSEYIGMSIRVGGELPANLIKEFLATLENECSEMTGPTTEKELRKEAGKKPVVWYACTNYGECEDFKAFCKEHKLSYVHHSEATCEYNASISYWTPGMKVEHSHESNQNGDRVIDIDIIKPYVDLLIDYAKIGKNALPLYVENESLVETIEKCMKNPAKTLQLLEKKFQTLLPGEPKLPPFVITGYHGT